jgi:hypothetical protein
MLSSAVYALYGRRKYFAMRIISVTHEKREKLLVMARALTGGIRQKLGAMRFAPSLYADLPSNATQAKACG